MMKMKKALALLLALMMVISLASCSSEAGGTETENVGNPSQAGTQDDGPKSITWVSNTVLPNLDKFNQTGSIAPKVAKLWGDSLAEGDHKGNYVPFLAESIEFSDDYMTCTIKLREGIYFNNGEPLTADDVVFTFERIQGLETWTASKWTAYLGTIEATDELTAVIHFSTLMPYFYTEVSSCAILNRDAYEEKGEDFWKAPVGIGAFTVESFDDMTGEVKMTRNDDWWGWEYYGEKTNIDTIYFKSITEDTTRVSALRSGEVDVIEYVPNDNISILQNEGLQAAVTSTYEHAVLELNCTGVFADKNLRQALSECIDRELLVNTVVGGGTAANYVCNPGTMGYNESASYITDIEHAKELVAASNYDGSEIRLVCTQSMTRVSEVAQAIQAFGDEIGLKIQPYIEENSKYNDDKSAGSYDIVMSPMGTNGEDNNMEVVEVVGTDRFKSGFDNDALKAVCAEAATYVDTATRADAYQRAYDMIMEDYGPLLSLYYNQSCLGYNSALTNIYTYVGGGYELRFAQLG